MTNKQVLFLTAMLEESTITAAARKAGISRVTANNYLKEPSFRIALDEKRAECMNDAVRYMQGKLSMCSESLVQMIQDNSTPAAVKVQAINAVFNNCRNMIETSEIIQRLNAIEKMMEDEKHEYDGCQTN